MSVEEWAQHCPACGQRNDCEHKLLGRALVKIEILNERIAELEEAMKKIMLTSNEQKICGIAANAYAPPCDEE